MFSYARRRRLTRTALTIAALLASICLIIINNHNHSRHHTLKVASLEAFDPKSPLLLPKEPTESERYSICHNNGFRPFNLQDNAPRRKVYDLILLSTELDWLEIRLHTLSPWVDYFVIVESPTTFTGRPKVLHLRDNWSRFSAFHSKILHHVVQDGSQSRYIWDHEDWLRNSLLHSVFPGLEGSAAEAVEGDVFVVSGVDEVLRPETMFVLRNCHFPQRLTLLSDFYYYSFQWKHREPQWAHPEATVYRGSATLQPNSLRQGLLDGSEWNLFARVRRWWDKGTLANAGWHCSGCFATVKEMQTKMHSFSHQELDQPENSNARAIMARVRTGQDLFGRQGEVYDKVMSSRMDVPKYVVEQNREEGRFKYLLNRDGDDAGFEDWEEAMREGGQGFAV